MSDAQSCRLVVGGSVCTRLSEVGALFVVFFQYLYVVGMFLALIPLVLAKVQRVML